MAKFDAAQAVDPLDYDFRPFTDAQGTVPEPSDEAIRGFYVGLSNTLENALGKDRLEGVDVRDPGQVAKLNAELTEEDMERMQGVLMDLHAGVCGHQPGRDALEKLPYRVKQAWYGMVQGWLRPEASRPATKS